MYVIIKELLRNKQIPFHVKTFYYGHIANVILYNISWIPAYYYEFMIFFSGYAHMMTFTFQLNVASVSEYFVNVRSNDI